jgi:pectinesterase
MRSLTVASDGSADYARIQDAVDSIPAGSTEETRIHIRNGVYKEKLVIDKPFVRLIGEDRKRTIITYDDYALKAWPDGELYHTFHSYTLFIGADDCSAESLTIKNTAGPGESVGQALAAYVDADRVMIRDCRLLGYQDTLFTGPLPPAPRERGSFGGPSDRLPRRPVRQYYERCWIEGDVDFIFGSATAVFDRCEIRSRRRGWITAASTPKDAQYGYVFVDCRLSGDAPSQSVYLGRPWRNDAKTAYLNCWMGPHIAPEGWSIWNEAESVQAVDYAEYGSHGPGAAGKDRRAGWSRQLTSEQAEAYGIRQVLAGTDGWEPNRS